MNLLEGAIQTAEKKGIEKGREEGERIGQLKGQIQSLMILFGKGNNNALNFLAESTKKRSLSQNLIQEVWKETENKPNKTVGSFIKVLKEKGLLEDRSIARKGNI